MNHGARLEKEALAIAAESPYVFVALGPDYYLSTVNGELLDFPEERSDLWFLERLREALPPDKILLDIDYDYNSGANGLDCSAIDRILMVWSHWAARKILFENASHLFFGGQYP